MPLFILPFHQERFESIAGLLQHAHWTDGAEKLGIQEENVIREDGRMGFPVLDEVPKDSGVTMMSDDVFHN